MIVEDEGRNGRVFESSVKFVLDAASKAAFKNGPEKYHQRHAGDVMPDRYIVVLARCCGPLAISIS